MLLNERHAVHSLLQEELRRPRTLLHPEIGQGKIRAALCIAGFGLDHDLGEQAMMLAHTDDWQLFTLVTDRRVLGASYDKRYAFRLDDVASVTVENSILSRRVNVKLHSGSTVHVVNEAIVQPLGAFLKRLATVTPADRTPPPRPLCAPSEADPTGAECAIGWLGDPEPRSVLLLRFIAAAYSRDMMPAETGQDLVRRVVQMHRNLLLGRGMMDGRWQSPISANDLCNAMVELYGNPLSALEQPVRTLEFQSGLKTQTGKAVMSSAVGLASAAILGVGWTSGARRRLDRFRFMVADTPGAASFRLQAKNGKGLEHDEPGLQQEIDGKLLPMEDAMLFRRVLYGWRPTTMELLHVGGDALEAKLAETLG